MASPPRPPYFLTFNGKKYHPSLEWNDEEGLLQDPSNHAPHSSKKRFQGELIFFFLVGKFIDFMFCWKIYGGALSFCCCLILWEFLDIVWFGWKSLCGYVDFLFWGIFELLSCLVLWSLDNVGHWLCFVLDMIFGHCWTIFDWLWVWNVDKIG